MKIDFASIPEYVLFKDLTSLDKIYGCVTIDPSYEPTNFKKDDRATVFKELLEYYKNHEFKELQIEYFKLLSQKSYTNYRSIEMFNSFVFNHPMIVLITMFIEQGLLTMDLDINSHVKKLALGNSVFERTQARELKIEEGVIFADGTLLKIESKEAHKIGALWLFLNGKKLHKAIRYTDDCINPEPIFTSLNEYAELKSSDIVLTKEQAVAIYNIHLSRSRTHIGFEQILKGSKDLSITADGNPEVRYENVKTLERVLGKEVFCARELLEEFRYDKTVYRDV